MNRQVSIIIPVYNAEAYLTECVHSLTGQTYPYLELLLLDDGSTDGSLALCQQLAGEDERIRVLHHENRGPSATRNRGLAEAQGDYIAFADADDWLEPTAIASMVEAAETWQAELVIGAYGRFEDGQSQDSSLHRLTSFSMAVLDGTQDLASLFTRARTSLAGVSIWAKLYRADLIRQHGVAFPEDVNYEEDCCFNLQYYRFVTRAIALRDCIYHYRQTPKSLTKTYRTESFVHQLNAYHRRCAFFGEIGLADKLPALRTIMVIVLLTAYKKIALSAQDAKGKRSAYAALIQNPDMQEILQDVRPPAGRLIRLVTAATKAKSVSAVYALMAAWKMKQSIKKRLR